MKYYLGIIFSFIASFSYAQAIAIHQYPYDSSVTTYSDPSTWPVISQQCHWRPANSNIDTTMTPQLISPSLGHTHFDPKSPIYGEITGSFVVPFTITLFHVDGGVNPSDGITGWGMSNLVLDDPSPFLQGDPNGIKLFTGHFTFTPGLAHGWSQIQWEVDTRFANGGLTRSYILVPFYFLTDPTSPENNQLNGLFLEGRCLGGSATDSTNMGQQVVSYESYVPILSPLTTAIPQASWNGYGYGTIFTLPNGTGMSRFGMDLHNGITGTEIQSLSVPVGQLGRLASPFDPAILGQGSHKVAIIWQQDSGMGVPNTIAANEQTSELIVVTVTVGNAPPPVITWTTLQGLFQQQDQDTTKYRLCPDAACANPQLFMKMN